MCRQNQLWGCALMAFGVGIFVGMLLEGGFLCGCFGFGMLILGFCVMHRK